MLRKDVEEMVQLGKLLKKIVDKIFKCFGRILGIEIVFSRAAKKDCDIRGKRLINVGAGDWKCRGWICLDYSSPWYASMHKGGQYIEYDIRNDKLPFADETVDAIYCSHVIEHIENEYIQSFFLECHRVLKKGGILRVCCPDAEFLWNASQTDNSYWIWRKILLKQINVEYANMRQVDFLVREIATERFLDYISGNGQDYNEAFLNKDMDNFFEYITEGLTYDPKKAGYHINYWTFSKVKDTLIDSNFTKIIRSKYAGSISEYIKNKMYFDKTFPEMSLYVEAIK